MLGAHTFARTHLARIDAHVILDINYKVMARVAVVRRNVTRIFKSNKLFIQALRKFVNIAMNY